MMINNLEKDELKSTVTVQKAINGFLNVFFF